MLVEHNKDRIHAMIDVSGVYCEKHSDMILKRDAAEIVIEVYAELDYYQPHPLLGKESSSNE